MDNMEIVKGNKLPTEIKEGSRFFNIGTEIYYIYKNNQWVYNEFLNEKQKQEGSKC